MIIVCNERRVRIDIECLALADFAFKDVTCNDS